MDAHHSGPVALNQRFQRLTPPLGLNAKEVKALDVQRAAARHRRNHHEGLRKDRQVGKVGGIHREQVGRRLSGRQGFAFQVSDNLHLGHER